MINVSQEYKELTQSNIRPKCEPKIKVSGKDANGNNVEIVWTANNIKDLTYKRGIDPVGRELPFMELTWNEIYSGKLDENLFPEKYNNIAKFMKVELTFNQKLNFFNSWKIVYSKLKTWQNVFKKSWKQIREEVETEEIRFPTLFLTARPTYKNQVITWKAVDVLSFLEEKQTKKFVNNISFTNPIKYLIINEMGNFLQSNDILNCLEKCRQEVDIDFGTMEYASIFDGKTKDLIVEYFQLKPLYLDFKPDGQFYPFYLGNNIENGYFSTNTLRDYPEIQKTPNISNYNFKSYTLVDNVNKKYTKTPVFYKKIGNKDVYKVDFDGYGKSDDEKALGGGLNYTLSFKQEPIEIIPLNWESKDNILSSTTEGEAFVEDIKVNVYDQNNSNSTRRFNYLKSYFNNSSTIKFSCLSDLSVTTGDIVTVETNMYKGAERTTKKGYVVQIELKYSGTVKQTLTVHEIA